MSNTETQILVEPICPGETIEFYFAFDKTDSEINSTIWNNRMRGMVIREIHWKMPERKPQTIVFYFDPKKVIAECE